MQSSKICRHTAKNVPQQPFLKKTKQNFFSRLNFLISLWLDGSVQSCEFTIIMVLAVLRQAKLSQCQKVGKEVDGFGKRGWCRKRTFKALVSKAHISVSVSWVLFKRERPTDQLLTLLKILWLRCPMEKKNQSNNSSASKSKTISNRYIVKDFREENRLTCC